MSMFLRNMKLSIFIKIIVFYFLSRLLHKKGFKKVSFLFLDTFLKE